MKCSKCKTDGFITGRKLCFEGDNSPDTATKAFYEMTYSCRNPQCSENGKEIGKEKVYLEQ